MLVIIIFTGFLVGLVSTYFGIGGGVIIVPVLYTIFPSLAPETVISTSLAVISLNNFVNIFIYQKKGLYPQYKIIIPLTIIMLIGVFWGTKVTAALPAIQLKRLFSFVLMASSIFTFFKSSPAELPTDKALNLGKMKWLVTAVCFFMAGIISTTTGIGGGILVIPLFIHLIKIPYRIIPVNANIIVLFGVLLGTVFYLFDGKTYQPIDFGLQVLQIGPINLNLVFLIAFFALFTSFAGIKISQKTNPAWSKRCFAIMLLVVAISFFTSTL